MKNNKLFLDRKVLEDVQHRGSLYVVNNDDLKEVYRCNTLELPYINNNRNISSIPGKRTYMCKKRYSDKYGHHIHVLDVPDRDMILIHVLNYYTQTRGCIGVGQGYADTFYYNMDDVLRQYVEIKLNK